MKALEITAEHVTKILAAAETESRYPTRDVALLKLLADVGMRPTEAAALTWAALVDAEGHLTGRCIWDTAKRGGRRDVTLGVPTVAALERLRQIEAEAGLPFNWPVFRTERNGRFTDKSMRTHLKNLCAKAGLRASGYSIRHHVFDSEAQAISEANGTAEDLRFFTGHKNISSVGAYLDKHSAVRAKADQKRAERVANY